MYSDMDMTLYVRVNIYSIIIGYGCIRVICYNMYKWGEVHKLKVVDEYKIAHIVADIDV